VLLICVCTIQRTGIVGWFPVQKAVPKVATPPKAICLQRFRIDAILSNKTGKQFNGSCVPPCGLPWRCGAPKMRMNAKKGEKEFDYYWYTPKESRFLGAKSQGLFDSTSYGYWWWSPGGVDIGPCTAIAMLSAWMPPWGELILTILW